MKTKEEMVEWLNDAIRKKPRYVLSWEVCESCPENECECCGQEIECDHHYDRERCPRIRETIKKGKETREDFQETDNDGFPLLANHQKIMAVVYPPKPIEAVITHFEIFNNVESTYEALEGNGIKGTMAEWDQYIIGKKGIPQNTRFDKHLLDSILKIAGTPKIFYAYQKPLIIQGEEHIFMIAPFFEED